MTKSSTYWVEKLNLIRHPEGGYFREIYRSDETIEPSGLPERFSGKRTLATSIYFLIGEGDFSSFHKLKADEVWHFYTGTSVTIYVINPRGVLSQIVLGNDFENGEVYQAVVPNGTWFAARVNDPDSYGLVGCSLAPGFDFDDFQLGNSKELCSQFPQHSELIKKLTRL